MGDCESSPLVLPVDPQNGQRSRAECKIGAQRTFFQGRFCSAYSTGLPEIICRTLKHGKRSRPKSNRTKAQVIQKMNMSFSIHSLFEFASGEGFAHSEKPLSEGVLHGCNSLSSL